MKDKIRKLARSILPERAFMKASAWYRTYRLKTRPQLTEEEFRSILTDQLGIRAGSVLFIHSSLSELFIGFSPTRIVRILRDLVGPAGTLLFPAAQFRIRAEDYLSQNPVFDVRNTRTEMGFLPEYVRWMQDSHRSLHPINSVVGIGKHAKELTEEHHLDLYPCGEKSPYYKIVPHNGLIVGLGIEPHYCLSFVHVVEDLMKDEFPLQTRMTKIFSCPVINQDGEQIMVDTLVAHRRIQHRDIKTYIKKHLTEEELKTIRVKGSVFWVADSRKLLDKMEQLARQNITIYTERAYKE